MGIVLLQILSGLCKPTSLRSCFMSLFLAFLWSPEWSCNWDVEHAKQRSPTCSNPNSKWMYRMHRSYLLTASRLKEVTQPSQSLIGRETSSIRFCKDTWHTESVQQQQLPQQQQTRKEEFHIPQVIIMPKPAILIRISISRVEDGLGLRHRQLFSDTTFCAKFLRQRY